MLGDRDTAQLSRRVVSVSSITTCGTTICFYSELSTRPDSDQNPTSRFTVQLLIALAIFDIDLVATPI
jgi:hypothetical protein